jgi:cation diffusion facilitator CzcD-associated flavoprotein CzcO
MARCDVAIIGAGPYGLAAGAYLRAADGLDVRVYGETMSFWERQMPKGMLLRSPWTALQISDPRGSLTLDRLDSLQQVSTPRPVPLSRFVAYGRWFQENALSDVDRRHVSLVTRERDRFRLALEDGETVEAANVVVAAGIARFAWLPPEFAGLGPALATHSSEHTDFAPFAGRSVAVIGAGQSALESAALLHEAGAEVEVITRAPGINWLHRSSVLHNVTVLRRLLYSQKDVGPAGVSWLVAFPGLFMRLPLRWRWPLTLRSIRPAAAAWLHPRTAGVRITTGRSVVSARPVAGRARLELEDGRQRSPEHVLLATGYRLDVAKYDFLSREIVSALRLVNGHPQLDMRLQSNVEGLYFVGATAEWTFGPLMRHVAGTAFAGQALVRGVLPRKRSRSLV